MNNWNLLPTSQPDDGNTGALPPGASNQQSLVPAGPGAPPAAQSPRLDGQYSLLTFPQLLHSPGVQVAQPANPAGVPQLQALASLTALMQQGNLATSPQPIASLQPNLALLQMPGLGIAQPGPQSLLVQQASSVSQPLSQHSSGEQQTQGLFLRGHPGGSWGQGFDLQSAQNPTGWSSTTGQGGLLPAGMNPGPAIAQAMPARAGGTWHQGLGVSGNAMTALGGWQTGAGVLPSLTPLGTLPGAQFVGSATLAGGSASRAEAEEETGGQEQAQGGRADKQPKKCVHNRQKNKCKDCRGAGICEHNRLRRMCKQCRGTGICDHNRQWSICTECRGSQICEHNRRKSRCKECGGVQICVHKRRRSRCKECGGSAICEHKRERRLCKDCKGSGICEHLRQRRFCKQCKLDKEQREAAGAAEGAQPQASVEEGSSAAAPTASPPSPPQTQTPSSSSLSSQAVAGAHESSRTRPASLLEVADAWLPDSPE